MKKTWRSYQKSLKRKRTIKKAIDIISLIAGFLLFVFSIFSLLLMASGFENPFLF